MASRQASKLQVMEIAAKQEVYKMKQSWRQASMQVSNSSVAKPWKLEQNTSGQASRQASRASSLWKLKQNNMTKKGPFFGPQNVRKSRRAKMGLPSSSFHSQLLLVKSASTWNKRFNKFATMKGPKLDPLGGTTFDFKGVHFLTPF